MSIPYDVRPIPTPQRKHPPRRFKSPMEVKKMVSLDRLKGLAVPEDRNFLMPDKRVAGKPGNSAPVRNKNLE